MEINNKIPWGLATGTLGVTKQQIEKKKLSPELMLELR
jgi:hypothetical protein